MEETYEEIVRKWYVKLRGSFTNMLMDRYKDSNMRLADVENIYQNVFIAIHQNLEENRINANCDWRNYIIRVGLNMAGKLYRQEGKVENIPVEDPDEEDAKVAVKLQKINEKLDELNHVVTPDEDPELFKDPEAQALMGEELTHTPEPCATIIRMTYTSDMTDEEIAEELPQYRDNGKPTGVNAKAVKARRWLCMRDFIYRVKLSLFTAGIIDEKPVKPTRNSKKKEDGK